MRASIYSPHKNRQVRHHRDFLVLDDVTVADLLRDLRIYEYVPSLEPLRTKMIALSAKLAKIRNTRPSGHMDAARTSLMPHLKKFYELLSSDDYPALKKYLDECRFLEVDNIVLSESPY